MQVDSCGSNGKDTRRWGVLQHGDAWAGLTGELAPLFQRPSQPLPTADLDFKRCMPTGRRPVAIDGCRTRGPAARLQPSDRFPSSQPCPRVGQVRCPHLLWLPAQLCTGSARVPQRERRRCGRTGQEELVAEAASVSRSAIEEGLSLAFQRLEARLDAAIGQLAARLPGLGGPGDAQQVRRPAGPLQPMPPPPVTAPCVHAPAAKGGAHHACGRHWRACQPASRGAYVAGRIPVKLVTFHQLSLLPPHNCRSPRR